MNKLKLVSICTPCYNHEKYLDDYFNSILRQTYKNIELILIDDCSKDKSVKVINSYLERLKKKFVNVVYIKHKKNMGIVPSVNELLSNASGSYIKVFASDDIMSEKAIEKQVEYLNKNKNIGVCVSNGLEVDDDYTVSNGLRHTRQIYRYDLNKKFDRNNMLEELIKGNFIYAPCAMIRRTVYDKFGNYKEDFLFEDYEYWLRICKYIDFGFLNENLYFYRRADTSISNLNGKFGNKKFEYMMRGDLKAKMYYMNYFPIEKRKIMLERIVNEKLLMCIEYKKFSIAMRLYIEARKKNICISSNIPKKILECIWK